MKKALGFALAFILAACGTPAPAASATLAPPATPAVIVQTVLVTVVATQQTTEQPTNTAAPTQPPAAIAATDTPAAPAAPAATNAATTPVPTLAATATLPPDAGGGLFTNMTRSSDHFALRCQPDTITFGVSTDNVYVTGVDLYYRIEDRLSVSISSWQWGGGMVSDKHGNFTVDWSASKVDKDLRSHRAWFDYQFVGLNKQAQAVGRSLRIVKQITYTMDCSD
jgi:hypothetical protein